MDKYDPDVVERFWALVDKSGGDDACWPWQGPVRRDGYGTINLGNRMELAHRLALDLAGVTIPAGFVVVRSCGNRLCCNPAHLQPMSPSDAMAARSRLRRIPRPDRQDS